MQLPRHTITSHNPAPAFVRACFSTEEQEARSSTSTPAGNATTDANARAQSSRKRKARATEDTEDAQAARGRSLPDKAEAGDNKSIFACATRSGFFVCRSWPLKELARTDFPEGAGGLKLVVPIDDTSLLLLVGGGRNPRFAPNKVILWDEAAQDDVDGGERSHPSDLDSTSAARHNAAPSADAHTPTDDEDMSASIPDMDTSGLTSASNGTARAGLVSDLQQALISPMASSTMDAEEEGDESADNVFMSVAEIQKSTSDGLEVQEDGEPSGPKFARKRQEAHSNSVGEGSARSAQKRQQSAQPVAEIEFGEEVRAVHAKSFKSPLSDGLIVLLVCVLKSKAAILEIGDFAGTGEGWTVRQRLVLNVTDTSLGLGAISRVKERPGLAAMALPGKQLGHVQVIVLNISAGGLNQPSESSHGPSTMIAAHTSSLSSIALSACGSLLATTSAKGTLMRVWSVLTGSGGSGLKSQASTNRTKLGAVLIRELRRGLDTAKIHDVRFSPDSRYLAAASETGTIHFFSLQGDYLQDKAGKTHARQHSASSASQSLRSLSQIVNLVPSSVLPQYFKSEWSFAQYRVPLRSFSARANEGGDPKSNEGWVKIGGKESTASGPSSEGQWASLRDRIEDVRRGDAGIDEEVFLSWIQSGEEYNLIAITTAGNYYRISLDSSADGGGAAASSDSQMSGDDEDGSVVLDMYKSSSRRSPQKEGKERTQRGSAAAGCKLEEYRRFGMMDGFAI